MIQSINITNSAGNILDINLRSSLDDHGLQVFNLEGLGSPKATVSGLSGPTYDGISGEFVRADARQLLLTLAIPVRGDAEETAKQLVYDFFPVKDEITFRIITDAKDAYATAIVESVEMNQFAKVVNAVVSLYCTNPYFLDMVEEYDYGEYGGTEQTINYKGEVPTPTLITVICGDPYAWGGGYESMGTCLIENDRDSQSMTIEFEAFALGDKYFIDGTPGQKSVIHEDGATHSLTDVTSMVIPTSDWIKLHPGDNVFNVTVAGTYQGGALNRPPTANLKAYLPLNDLEGDELELVGDRVFAKHLYPLDGTGELGNSPGKVYSRARQFHKDNFTSLLGPSDITLCPITDHTFVFWIYIDNFTLNQTILDILEDLNYSGIEIQVKTNTTIEYNLKRLGGDQIVASNALIFDTWYCFFCWYDLSTTTAYIQIDLGTPNSNATVLPPIAYTSSWRLGADSQYITRATARFQGLALYDYILTGVQKTWVYNSGNGRTYGELVEEHELGVLYRPQYQGV